MEYIWCIFSFNILDEIFLKNLEKNFCWFMFLFIINRVLVLDVMGKNWLYVLLKKNKYEKIVLFIIYIFYLLKSVLFI